MSGGFRSAYGDVLRGAAFATGISEQKEGRDVVMARSCLFRTLGSITPRVFHWPASAEGRDFGSSFLSWSLCATFSMAERAEDAMWVLGAL